MYQSDLTKKVLGLGYFFLILAYKTFFYHHHTNFFDILILTALLQCLKLFILFSNIIVLHNFIWTEEGKVSYSCPKVVKGGQGNLDIIRWRQIGYDKDMFCVFPIEAGEQKKSFGFMRQIF